ncbi:MAG: DUF3900 domain-containing protein [Paenibacillaceae bacterium]
MEFTIDYLSFFVVQAEDKETNATKAFRHYQTLNQESYMESDLKAFLNSEFARIARRKVEKNPNSEQAPTKIGHFIVEPEYELDSNPNYNLFQTILTADTKSDFQDQCDGLVRLYMDTSSVRGGALIISRAKLPKYTEASFLFIMKCDFEPNIARISDEKNLISQVEMAISARNIKSIQYPYMPEPGMIEERELKIHQSSHARYFEDFLHFISYEKSMPEIINEQMSNMVYEYIEQKYPDREDAERKEEVASLEVWAASEKRVLQRKWEPEQVMEATLQMIEQKEDIELKFKLDGIGIKALLSQYGDQIHITRLNNRYVILIEGEALQFEKGVSPVELLDPPQLYDVMKLIEKKMKEED